MTDATNRILSEAYELIEAEKLAEAESLLKPILASEPENADAWWLYAHAVPDVETARMALNTVLKLDGSYPGAAELMRDLEAQYPTESELLEPEREPAIKKLGTSPSVMDLPEDQELDLDAEIPAGTIGRSDRIPARTPETVAAEPPRAARQQQRGCLLPALLGLLALLAVLAVVWLVSQRPTGEAGNQTGTAVEVAAGVTETEAATEDAVATDESTNLSATPTEELTTEAATEDVATEEADLSVTEGAEPTEESAALSSTQQAAETEDAAEPTEENTGQETPEEATPEATEAAASPTAETGEEDVSTPESAAEATAEQTSDASANGIAEQIQALLAEFTLSETAITTTETALGETLLVGICSRPGQELRDTVNGAMTTLAGIAGELEADVNALGIQVLDCDTDELLRVIAVTASDASQFSSGAMDETMYRSKWTAAA